MAKRKRSIDEQAISKRIKEGRGQGFGKDYKPWLHIQDVPSIGKSARIKGWKTGRSHQLLSDLETKYFFILEWGSNVTDIREQYPLLELDETLSIADRLGIKHPTDPKTQQPIVMTTDFLITIKDKSDKFVELARTIKCSEHLSSDRVLEKLDIEHVYWLEKNIDWRIVTEHEIDTVIAENVKWLHPHYNVADLYPVTESIINRIDRYLTPYILKQQIPLRDLTNDCDDKLGYSLGTSLMVVRHLIANKLWNVDIKRSIDTAEPLVIHTTTPVKNIQL